MDDLSRTPESNERPARRWTRLAIAIVVVQVAWWLLVQPVLFSRAKPPPRIPVVDASIATPEAPDWQQVSAARFEPITLPHHDCCGAPGYRALRVHFELASVPPEGLGLIANTWADNFTIHVNGSLASARGRLELPDITYHGLERRIYFLSPGLLQAGRNELTIVMVRAGIGEFAAGPPLLASYPVLLEHMKLRDFILNDYNIVSYTIGMVLMVLAVILLVRSRDRRLPAWTLALLSVWVSRLVLIDSAEPPVGGLARLGLGYVAMGFLPIAWLNFVDAWTGKPLPRLAPWSLAAFVFYAVGCTVLVRSDPGTALDDLDTLLAVFGGSASVAIFFRLAWHGYRNTEARAWETAMFLLCVTLMTLDLADLVGSGGAFYSRINTSLPLLMMGLAAAFFSRNIHLFRSMNEFNRLLTQKLDASRAELVKGIQERQEYARQTALAEERQRIMRDMHDGLGGRLVSLAAQLRRPRTPTDPDVDRLAIARELTEALEEMRMIVDSLDTAGDDLGMALGAFRSRMDPKLADAGLATGWSFDSGIASLHVPAAAVLDIYRLMQEACANVLRHAQASRIDIRVTCNDGGALIEIQDDGIGIPEEATSTGIGRSSMVARAHRIGARVEWVASTPGTCVRLWLPPVRGRTSQDLPEAAQLDR